MACGGSSPRRRLGDDRHLLHGLEHTGVDPLADPVAQLLGGQVVGDGDREVAPGRRHRAHRAVGLEVEHLPGDPGIGRAQKADVGDALSQHERAVEAEAQREPRPLRGVEPARLAGRARPPGRTRGAPPRPRPPRPRPRAPRSCTGAPPEAPGCARAGQGRRDDEADHLLQVIRGERLAPAHAPQVELVRLADVEPIDHVAAVDQARACHDDVAGAARRDEAAKRIGDHRRHVRPQEPVLVEIARVPGLPRRGSGRIAERLVVRADRDDRARPVDQHRSAPGALQGVADRVREKLHGMRPRGRIGQVAQRERAVELVLSDDGMHRDPPGRRVAKGVEAPAAVTAGGARCAPATSAGRAPLPQPAAGAG